MPCARGPGQRLCDLLHPRPASSGLADPDAELVGGVGERDKAAEATRRAAWVRCPGSVQRLALSGVDGHQGLYRCRVPDDLLFDEDHEDDDDGPVVRIVEERPPLREGEVFVDYGERATIGANLEAAYVALNQAFPGDLDRAGPGSRSGPRVLG